MIIAHSQLQPGHIAKISYFQAMCAGCHSTEEMYEQKFVSVEKALRAAGWRYTKSRGWFCRKCVRIALEPDGCEGCGKG